MDKKYKIQCYAEFGQKQSDMGVMFDTDDIAQMRAYVTDYFKYENYFNAVYFTDTSTNKSGYLGRDLCINGETLESFCNQPPHQPTFDEKFNEKFNDIVGYVHQLNCEINRLKSVVNEQGFVINAQGSMINDQRSMIEEQRSIIEEIKYKLNLCPTHHTEIG